MKKRPVLMAAIVALFSLNLTACVEEKATTPVKENTAQVSASTENAEKSNGANAPTQAETKDEKKAEGGAEPDCN